MKKGVKRSGTFIADNHYFLNSVIEPKLEVKEETLKAKSSDLSSNNLMKILEMSQEFKRPKYFCDVCHVNNNSQMNLKQHLAGKKHLRMTSGKAPSMGVQLPCSYKNKQVKCSKGNVE